MKLEITFSKVEAQAMLSQAIINKLGGAYVGLSVEEVEWSRFSSEVTVKLTNEREQEEEATETLTPPEPVASAATDDII